jgi:hypothetical protein
MPPGATGFDHGHAAAQKLSAAFARAASPSEGTLNQRGAFNPGALAAVFGFLVMAVMHILAAHAVISGLKAAQYEGTRERGLMMVSDAFAARAQMWEESRGQDRLDLQAELEERYAGEAEAIARRTGGDRAQAERDLRAAVATQGSHRLISRESAVPGLTDLPHRIAWRQRWPR